ncbi:polysaccharide pyruvyl transferase family protein [Nocardioides bizhenqiangii]|uniref:Polysaccharide pyruvyl transferase family protein n=1 Tax=Nocardioides bizhenqiangii TaxID=3095076 RepID=A0ABZ0ZME6_9ACTN|nr:MULTISPECIES: polysaccharide pyruvyl transferase family protein [unclassified Nocardioides]MDZ5621226.1 polysaccharide pyruvyl transferase family protein [Nocardioides sp. HM23]WQQ25482.1 polysaccharide pyruvyl transferase family protein [Nocardioides sp. HM61]
MSQGSENVKNPTIHLVSTAGHPNFGDEFIAASWLRFLAERQPASDVVLDCPDPGMATFLFEGLHPRVKFTNLLWRVSWMTMDADPDEGDVIVDRTVTELGSPLFDLGLIELRRATTVHLIGGGHITANWMHHGRLVRAARRLAEVSGARFVATGLGLMPPIDPERIRDDLGAADHATVRDSASAEMAGVDLGVNDAFLGLPALPGFGARPDPTGQPGDVWINIQSDLAEPEVFEANVAAVRAMLESGRFEGRTIRYLEAIPGVDRDRRAYDLLADLIPEENFMSFVRLWHEGFPGRPLQTWITTRYHFHQLAAAVGAEGVAIEIDDSYYRTKHQSLAELGTGFPIAPAGSDKLPDPASDPEFRLKAGRLHRAKLDEAEALYPRARAQKSEPVREPVAPVAPQRSKGVFGRR